MVRPYLLENGKSLSMGIQKHSSINIMHVDGTRLRSRDATLLAERRHVMFSFDLIHSI